MSRDPDRLRHIVEAAQELAEFLSGIDVDDFLEDRLRQRAVERLLTIIGEAAKQLSEETRAAIDQPWREIIRFREKGIHGYDALSPKTLHGIATVSVPRLANAVQRHLASRPKR